MDKNPQPAQRTAIDTTEDRGYNELKDYQRNMLIDELLAHVSVKNKVREALTIRVTEMILKGHNADELIKAIERLTTPDAFTQKIFDRYMG